MSDPPEATTPAEISVDPPPENDESISFWQAIGFSNRMHGTKLWSGGGGSPFCYGSTNGDMFLSAAKNCQMASEDQQHRVGTENCQYYKEVDRKVEGKQTVLIGGNNTIAVDGTQTVNVVGHHVLNVKGTQTTTAFGGQSVTVKDGGRKLTIDSGGYTRTIQGNHNYTRNANDKTEIIGGSFITNMSANLSSIVGDFMTIKLSSETAITASEKVVIGLAGELSATFGVAAKLNLAVNFEQTFSSKATFNSTTEKVSNMGFVKKHDTTYDYNATLDDLKKTLAQEEAKFDKILADVSLQSGMEIH